MSNESDRKWQTADELGFVRSLDAGQLAAYVALRLGKGPWERIAPAVWPVGIAAGQCLALAVRRLEGAK